MSSKMRSLVEWYTRWRRIGYRDLYRLAHGDDREQGSKGLERELNFAYEILKEKYDRDHKRLAQIKLLHIQDKRFPTDCVSGCKEGYPCNHYKKVTGATKTKKVEDGL